MLEIFRDGRHFDLLLQCSSVVCFDFDHSRRIWRARRFVVKRMRRWEEMMKPLHCKTVLGAYCRTDSFIVMKMELSFTTLIYSRGWYVYQKPTWKNPKKDEALSFKKETGLVGLRFDAFSIAFTRTSIEYLTPLTVGHIPSEISKFAYFFLEDSGKMEAKEYQTKCKKSPIPKEVLEIAA